MLEMLKNIKTLHNVKQYINQKEKDSMGENLIDGNQ